MYQLVFKGECVAGVEESEARANVARVFKASEAQIDRMFSGERVIIRNKLEREAAAKYRLALAKQGIAVHVEPMPVRDEVKPAAAVSEPAPSVQDNGGDRPSPPPPPPPPSPDEERAVPTVEPGDRLRVAGDKVDELLAGSGLTLGRAGETLGQPREIEAPVFTTLDNWSLAPVGERLAEPATKRSVEVGDLSHLELLPPGERR